MRLTSTAIAAGLAALFAAHPAFAETLTITNVEAGGGSFKVTVPTIEIVDGNVDEATIRALFAGDTKVLPAFAALDAKSINIPEITMTASYPVNGPISTYRDIVITDVVDGLAASAVLGATEVTSTPDVDVRFGEMSVNNFDIGALLGLYGLSGEAPSMVAETIYTDIAFTGGTINAPNMKCDLGPAQVAEFKARPPKLGQDGLMKLGLQLEAEERDGRVSPQTLAKAIAAYIDYVTSFEMSPVSFNGLDCTGTDQRDRDTKITIGKVSLGGWAQKVFPPITLDKLAVDVEEVGYLHLESATLKKMDFTPTVDALEAIGDRIDERWFAENWRSILPALDGLSIAGLDMDLPGNRRSERTKASLGSLDVTMSGHSGGIPSNTVISVDDLRIPIPETGRNELAAVLRNVGITEAVLGFEMRYGYDREAKTATIENIMLSAEDLGTVSISAVLGNVTEDVFSLDPRTSERATMMMTVRELHITLDNGGLVTLLMTEGAKNARQDEAQFRLGMNAAVAGSAMAVLGASPQTLQTVSAIMEFLEGKPKLELTLTSIDPNGIPFVDFARSQRDPRLLVGKINVTGVATGAIAQ